MPTIAPQDLQEAVEEPQPRLTRCRFRLTDTLVLSIEQHFGRRGQDLAKPLEARDSVMQGLLLRRQPTGRKVWHFSYSLGGRRGRIRLGVFPALGVEGARNVAKAAAYKVALGTDPVEEKRKERKGVQDKTHREKREAEEKRDQAEKKRLGAFVEGPYKIWAEATMLSHKATLEALRADFGNHKGREDQTNSKKRRTQKKGAGWWNRSMDEITKEDGDTWRASQIQLANKPTTVNRAWQRLRAVLGKAVDWGVIEGPPLRLQKLKSDKRGRVRYLSAEERTGLFAALDARERERRETRRRNNARRIARGRVPLPELPGPEFYTDYVRPYTRTLLGTGLRRNEGLTLRKVDLNFDSGVVHVRGDVAKNRQSRDVPMTKDVKRCLSIWVAQHPHMKPEDLIFTRNGRRIRRVGKYWKNLMVRAQITNFRTHDTRHDYASRLAMADVSLRTIAELLGHEDLSMVQRYAHLSPGHLRAAVRRLDDPTPVSGAETLTGVSVATTVESALAIAA
jgi:integrase